MQGNHLVYTWHIPGTLAANASIVFTTPFNLSLEKVSAVASNDSDATLKIGTSADDDGYLPASTIGDSGTPVVFSRANFTGALTESGTSPHIAAGTVVALALDFDGAAGTAAQNVTIALVFSEG